ncbi:MAG: succinate dehydrogenase cytochrome b subunit [Candidatus Latescibacterota bacterium]
MPSRWFVTSVDKKVGMALSGMVLYGFLVGHLMGNLLLLKGDAGTSFNAYSAYLAGHPLLIPVELLLLACFLLHAYLGALVSLENRRARPVDYVVHKAVGGRNWANRTMIYSGILIGVFLVLHLKTFKYADRQGGTLYDLVLRTFRQPLYVAWYVAAMVILGFHLWHSLQSAFQTLGIGGPRIRPLGLLVGVILSAGFGFLPAFIYAAK